MQGYASILRYDRRPLRHRLLAMMLVTATFVLCAPASLGQEVAELQVNSSRYIVIDVQTGNVYAQRDAHERVAFASLTKVFTASLAMDIAPLDTPITTEDFDLRSPDGAYFGENGTVMGFESGETYTLEDMIYGMLLPSGNDAANAIARTLGMRDGDTPEQAVAHFMELLNQRVADLGLKDTQLMNPHGWGVDGHYSTAWDIASFIMYARHNDTLVKMMGTPSYTTSNGLITVSNTNRLLTEFDAIIGGKTGYDLDSGYCLVNLAGTADSQVIAVTLDGIAPGDWYDDNRVLIEYGLEQNANAQAGAAFNGEVAGFNDPAPAELARSARPGGSVLAATRTRVYAQNAPNPASEPVVAVTANTRDTGGARTTTTWTIVAIAIAVVLLRTFVSARRPRNRH